MWPFSETNATSMRTFSVPLEFQLRDRDDPCDSLMNIVHRPRMRQMPRESRRHGKLPTHENGEKSQVDMTHLRNQIPI
jgi:hypothetical protein